jgi:hypothetical protein
MMGRGGESGPTPKTITPSWQDVAERLDAERLENEATIKRLREALGQIVDMAVAWEPLTPGDIRIATEALEAEDEN